MNNYKRKVLLLGDGAVGKTSLVRRFVDKSFSDEYIATIGANIKKKEIIYDEKDICLKLMIADLIGQQGYQNTQRMNMLNSNAAILVSDLTREKTLYSLEDYWIPLLEDVLNETPPLIFLANKSDLIDIDGYKIKNYRTELFEISKKYNSNFYLTSAKTGENVEEAFKKIGLISIDSEYYDFYFKDLYCINEEINSTKALDLFKSQLYMEIGNQEFANSILKKQFKEIGIDVRDNKHSEEKLTELVEKLKEINLTFLSKEQANKIYVKRKGILKKIKH